MEREVKTDPEDNTGKKTPEPPPPPAKKPSSTHEIEMGIIGIALSAVGLALAVIVLPLETRWLAAEIITCLLLLIGLLLCRRWAKRFLPPVIAAALVIVLATLSFHWWRERKLPTPVEPLQVTDNQVTEIHRLWIDWENRVKKGVKGCNDRACIAGVISANHNYPRTNSRNLIDQLNADIRAGAVLMNMEEVYQTLNAELGVQRNFIGDGLAVPNDRAEYWANRVPEFLVNNLRESHAKLWTWELSPKDAPLEKKVNEILEGAPITELRGRSDKPDFLNKIKNNVSKAEEPPAVIRFGKFPRSGYKHTLARCEKKKAFVLRLRDVYDKALRDAANLSGHSLDPTNEDRSEYSIWIWVYLPGDPQELTPPTWGKIIASLKDWSSSRDSCN